MPALDWLMVILWIVFIVFGALTGSIRQIVLLVSIYAAVILAGSGHPLLAAAIGAVVAESVSVPTLEAFSFLIILVLGTMLLYLGFNTVFMDTRPVQQGARRADTLAGGLIGVASGVLTIVALYAALAFVAGDLWPTLDEHRITVRGNVEASVLQPVLEEKVPVVYNALRPWIPRGLPGFPIA